MLSRLCASRNCAANDSTVDTRLSSSCRNDLKRLPVTIFQDGGVRSAPAALRALTVRDRRLILWQQWLDRIEKRLRAKAVAGAMGSASLDSIAPAFDCAINDRRRLTVVQVERETLRRRDLLPIETVRHVDDIPVVQVSEFGRRPLHIVARRFALAADPVRIDRRLVPIHVQDDVIERCSSRRRQRLRHAPGSHSTFAFDNVDARCVLAVEIGRAPGQTARRREADTGRAGREPNEWRRRRRVSVERLGAELCEERRVGRWIAAEAEQIFQAKLKPLLNWEQLRRGDAGDFVAQRPHRIKTERLVPGGIGNHVGVAARWFCEVIIHRVEDKPRHETPGRNRAARMPGERRVVIHQGAERAVKEIKRFADLEGGLVERFALFRQAIGGVDVKAATRTE